MNKLLIYLLIMTFQGVSYYITDHTKPLMGCRRWATDHQAIYPDEDELRKECEEYMAGFDEREKLKLQREKEMAETPDEVRNDDFYQYYQYFKADKLQFIL